MIVRSKTTRRKSEKKSMHPEGTGKAVEDRGAQSVRKKSSCRGLKHRKRKKLTKGGKQGEEKGWEKKGGISAEND